MWQFWHWLFGFHYVVVKFAFDDHVRLLRVTPAGEPYSKVCGQFIWLRDGHHQWKPLTFSIGDFNTRPRS